MSTVTFLTLTILLAAL